MKWLNRGVALFLIGVSALIFFLSLKLGVGEVGDPGPGFMPCLASVILFSLASLVLMMGIIRGEGKDEKSRFLPDYGYLVKPALLVLTILGYSFFLNDAGYLITGFFLMFVLFSITEPKKWPWNILVAGAVIITSFLLFKWLGVQLPAGIFRI